MQNTTGPRRLPVETSQRTRVLNARRRLRELNAKRFLSTAQVAQRANLQRIVDGR